MLWKILEGLALWCALSVPSGILIGKAIKRLNP